MGDMSKTLLEQRQWTYRVFEERFNAAAARLIERRPPTVSETQFRRWTAGKLKGLPSADTCRVLKDMFNVEAVALFAPAPKVDALVPQFHLEDEINMTARETQSSASEAAAASVSGTTLDQLRDDIDRLAHTYGNRSAYEVFTKARTLREEADRHRDRTHVPAQEQELLLVAGEACALLSTAAFDLGALDAAKRLARSADLYGETARFAPLRAFAAGSLAYVAYHCGQPTDAALLAQRGQLY